MYFFRKKYLLLSSLALLVACSVSHIGNNGESRIPRGSYADTLRYLYSLSPEKWPKATIADGVNFVELGIIPESPLASKLDSFKHIIELGKMLFFDQRLSGSGKISCATCHQPELSWTDGKARSIGHEGAMNRRNSPTIQNVWFYHKLFWDGRSYSLEDQAFSPINSESEMNSDMPQTTSKLRRIKGYAPLFDSAFGDHHIDPDHITEALAVFQRTIISNKSSFDLFLEGNKKALSDEQLRGLHLFRTKAGCINCHNGPLFSDNSFHNTGLSDEGTKSEDLGLFIKTRSPQDRGKFKTPSLRDVSKTGPWMHNGSFTSLKMIVDRYDTLIVKGEPLLRLRGMSEREKQDLIAFLEAISAEPKRFVKPVLPE